MSSHQQKFCLDFAGNTVYQHQMFLISRFPPAAAAAEIARMDLT
jgi:hypothetical protein